MADATPTPTAPEGLTLTWVAVADLKGTLRADWINRSGGAYASYARVDVRLRNKAAPSTTTRTVRTYQPFTGITQYDITGLDTRVSWEVEIVASAGGKTASSGWKSVDPLVTPKPDITGVERTSEADAWVYFTAPTSGLTRPTSAHVARSSATSDAGSSTPLNNVTLPATRVRLPIPAGTGAYRAWLSYHGPAGWSAKDVANVPAWWGRPDAPTNLSAVRRSSNRSQVDLTWQHSGTGGEAAESYLVEYTDDGQVWRNVTTTTSRSATVSLGLSSGRTYGVTAINKGGRSSRTTVKVEPWWERVPGATGLSSSRTSSGQIRLGWSVPSTTARNPVRSILVRRKPISGGDYQTVATLAATARSWVDGTTSHTSQWEYEVVTVGDLGWATTRPSVKVGVGMVAPDAPTGITVTRDDTSPDQLHVAFTPRSTDNAPTTDVRLKARDEHGRISNAGEWVRLSSLTTNTLTHNAGPNRVLSYAVEARNAAGASTTLTWSEPWATTPLGATRFTATRQGANIMLAWSAGATTADTWQIERSPDGGTNRYPLPDVAGDQRSTVMSGASYAVKHDFWIRPVRDGVAGEWVRAAATIPAGAPPQAPELLTSGWWPVNEPVTIQWRHVSADGSEQAQARIEYEVRGLSGSITGLTSVPVSGSAQTTDLPEMLSTAHSTRWRAQTRSAGSSVWSPWSGWETVQAAERPTLTLEVPTTITSQAIRGRIIPPDAWISAEVSLLDADGRVVDVRTLRYPETGFVFDRGIRDRQSYTVTAVLHDGRLPSVEQTVEVTVEWERPPAPRLTATPEGETVRLDVSVPAGLRITARNHAPDLGTIPSALLQGMSRVTGTLADTPEAGHFAGQSRTMWVLGPSMSFTRDDLGGATHWSAWLYNPAQADVNVTVWQDATPNSYVIPPATEGLLFGEVPPSGLVEISTDRGLWVTRSYGAVLEPGESWDGETGWFDPDSVPDPGVVQGWLPDGSIYRAVEAASAAEADLPAPQAIRVELIRITDGIERSLGDAQEGVGYDLWPRFCAPEQYIARAWAENGAWQDSAPVEATVHQRDLVVNFGPGLAQRISGGPRTLTITGGTIEKATRSYVGRDYPTQYDGDTRTPRIATLDLTLWKHHAPLREWEDAHNAGGRVLLRDASGEVIHGQLITGTRTPDHHLHRTVQITVTETADRP